MASAVVVLKHETSTLRQRHSFISIDFKFGVSDYVREVNSYANLVWIRWAVETSRGVTCTVPVTSFFILQQSYISHTHEPIFEHNSSKDAVWCKKDPLRDENVYLRNLGVFYPINTPKMDRKGQLPARTKFQICQWTRIMKLGWLNHIPLKKSVWNAS